MDKLEVNLKIVEGKYLKIGKTIYLNRKVLRAVGLWNNSVVLVVDNPRVMSDLQVRIYTISELRELFEEGDLTGLVEE